MLGMVRRQQRSPKFSLSKVSTFDEEVTGQREIYQGYMALTALMARIVVNLRVTGKIGFLMEICS